ncbi:hypothetical protein KIN20_004082 [Parelaphostrongylus tenuis]|uniref:Uncharacterized protein n=1 Tax=Parelaphostrongylus tenuis TaxID=148309 RepID=A0AAD5QJ16_PARTN|nr:hypothetical protein KIN20_004082 [Parelaphostrongylus tenuis]
MEPFSRKNSFKAIIYRSLRVPRKPKLPRPPKDSSIFLIKQASFDNLQILKSICEEFPTPMFPKNATRMRPCSLVQLFAGTVPKAYDRENKMTSFERKRRSHKIFGAAHHVNEQLFCPEQASQIELHFTSSCPTDVILQVQVPNGELSDYLYPAREQSVFFNPTKVGCGHGTWRINIAVRNGCRFRHIRTEEIELKGQGKLI